jgi:hypothetical protein
MLEEINFLTSRIEFIAATTFLESGLARVVVPPSVQVIGRLTCGWHKRLTEIVFASPSVLRTIDKCAFYHCSIHTIALPKSLEFICESCFAESEERATVVVEKGSSLTDVRENAFTNTLLSGIVARSENLARFIMRDCGCDVIIVAVMNDDLVDFYWYTIHHQ